MVEVAAESRVEPLELGGVAAQDDAEQPGQHPQLRELAGRRVLPPVEDLAGDPADLPVVGHLGEQRPVEVVGVAEVVAEPVGQRLAVERTHGGRLLGGLAVSGRRPSRPGGSAAAMAVGDGWCGVRGATGGGARAVAARRRTEAARAWSRWRSHALGRAAGTTRGRADADGCRRTTGAGRAAAARAPRRAGRADPAAARDHHGAVTARALCRPIVESPTGGPPGLVAAWAGERAAEAGRQPRPRDDRRVPRLRQGGLGAAAQRGQRAGAGRRPGRRPPRRCSARHTRGSGSSSRPVASRCAATTATTCSARTRRSPS